ncbi:hypothetical protein CDD81_2555 [Ophiocordyceps australis]|uniref:Uncharacterized protein n=1 Tax=Ophiocordyceps australis TaxID=1399860 RepID=A0A2C5XWM5_9HYPO|nr:hypothetical protein CDD81_2555 [Ophiocordyceps australis]
MTPEPEPQWPPRSPHEALVSTPGGRERYRRIANETSPSPSSRRARGAPARDLTSGNRRGTAGDYNDDDEHDDDDDDDEETLQLKLEAIKARLRLKKLQNAKSKDKNHGQKPGGETSRQRRTTNDTANPEAAHGTASLETAHGTAGVNIEVAASPVRKAKHTQQQSPSRVLLGIDKGLKAKDISLKRAPLQAGARAAKASLAAAPPSSSDPPRIQSFSERLATARAEEAARARRQEQARKARSSAFGIGKEEVDRYKKSAVDIPHEAEEAPSFTREQILSDAKTSFDTQLPRSSTAPNLTSCLSFGSKSMDSESTGTDKASSFEPYSCFHLSRRILPHTVLARHVSGKKTLDIKELLREVKSPNYSLPDVEQDIVVFGIVASKSEPRAHKRVESKNGVQAGDRGKYMVMTLADLDYEVDLFLFNTGFARFWKLTEGTVVAILNPGVMPPPPGRQDTGRFSLTINSDADTILEIGMARDLGFCKSVKKDGQLCGAWVNQRRTHYCEYHSNEAVRKQKSTRIEMNSTGFGRQEARHKKQQAGSSGKAGHGSKTRGANNYDWETKSHWFASRSFSAADLLDGKDRTTADRMEKKAILRRSLAAKEKERDMMKKLGRVGNAAGREYMAHGEQQQRAAATAGHASSKGQDAAADADRHDASGKAQLSSLGLANSKARQIHLSPVKRKRAESSRTSSSVSSSAKSSGYGWGSNLRDKLSSMRDGGAARGAGGAGKRDQGSRSPVRKKTRFVTDKGIREAGRESLGTDLTTNEGDDDDLIIVK